jgi:CDP-L-myo-inositol myo-inositolphosphotransferase
VDGTVTRALVLAAGQGSRLGPATPKPLLPVLGVPLLARTLFTLRKAGITEAFVVTGHQGERVRREIAAIRRLHEGFTVHWVENTRWEEPNGVSVLAAADRLDGPFLLTMADHVLDPAALARLREEAGKGRDLVLLVDRSPDEGIDPGDATKVALDGERIAAIGKDLEAFDAIDTGAFLAGPALLEALRDLDEGGRGPSLSDGVRRLAAEGKAWILDGTGMRWQDVDTPADVAAARRKLMAAWPKPTDGPVSRWINRPISLRVTRVLAPTGITPNHVSMVTLVMGLAAAWFASLGGYAWWLAAAATFQLASILDGTDGELAVLTYRQTEWGAWVDTLCDNVSYLAFIVGMTVGVNRAGLPDWYVVWGVVGLVAAALSMGNINMVLRREGRSGSALSVEYAHQQGTRLIDRALQVLHFLGKRDLVAFLGVVFALAGILPWGIPIFGVGASLLLFPVTLQANVAHWVRTRRAAAAAVAHSEATEFADGGGSPLSDHPAAGAEVRWEVLPGQGAVSGGR